MIWLASDNFGSFHFCIFFSKGYFVQPTIVQTSDPHDKIMTEEIFGPVLSIYVYPDKDVDSIPSLASNSVKFGLTGAVYAQDEWV